MIRCLNGTDHVTDHALITWLSCTDDVPQEAIIKELSRIESRNHQAVIMDLCCEESKKEKGTTFPSPSWQALDHTQAAGVVWTPLSDHRNPKRVFLTPRSP